MESGAGPSDGPPRKRRRIEGEDDTDKDLRLARQEQADKTSSADGISLVDKNGHIDLIQKPSVRGAEPSKRDKAQDIMGMRFADAAGRHNNSSQPWYSSRSADGGSAHESVSKDVWGNEDPGRVQREKVRADTNDPLAAMKRGVKQLREAEKSREQWKAQRERDLHEVEDLTRKERKRRRKKHSDEESLDDFDLDEGYSKQSERHHRHRHRDRKTSESGGHNPHRRRHREKDGNRKDRRRTRKTE